MYKQRQICSEMQESLFCSHHHTPDYNPIEEIFSYIKYYLKEHDEILQAMDDPVPLIEAAFDNITSEQCNGWINDSGYP